VRPTTPEGMREAWAVVKSFWDETMERARTLAEADLHRSVNDECGLPPSFVPDHESFGIDTGATPTFDEVVAVRSGRIASVRAFLETVTQEDLDRVRPPNTAPGGPPPASRTATSCLHVVFDEEWAHHRFAVRDLSIIEAERTGPDPG
jgi:DinB superfamily